MNKIQPNYQFGKTSKTKAKKKKKKTTKNKNKNKQTIKQKNTTKDKKIKQEKETKVLNKGPFLRKHAKENDSFYLPVYPFIYNVRR